MNLDDHYHICFLNTIKSKRGVDTVPFWTHRDALDNKELPASLAIIGGGVIGIEFASFFNSLGVSGVWVAFDNRGNECFVEEFKSEEIALSWINNEFSPHHPQRSYGLLFPTDGYSLSEPHSRYIRQMQCNHAYPYQVLLRW